jgi:hypothetical protein
VGAFRLEGAVTLDALAGAAARGALPELLLPPDEGLASWSAAILAARHSDDLGHGRTFPAEAPPGLLRAYDTAGEFLGVAAIEAGTLRPVKLFA